MRGAPAVQAARVNPAPRAALRGTSTLGLNVPKRIVRRRSFAIEAEGVALAPSTERRLWRLARQDAPRTVAAWSDAVAPDDRCCAAPRASMAALALGDRDLARRIAEDALRLAEDFRDSWNHGNAIHRAHTVLGVLALRSGDAKAAVEHLHAAGAVTGSPQLKSFGPSMWLARDLLSAGESQAVLKYLEQCRSFWSMGDEWLRLWELKVRRGAMPNFAMHLLG